MGEFMSIENKIVRLTASVDKLTDVLELFNSKYQNAGVLPSGNVEVPVVIKSEQIKDTNPSKTNVDSDVEDCSENVEDSDDLEKQSRGAREEIRKQLASTLIENANYLLKTVIKDENLAVERRKEFKRRLLELNNNKADSSIIKSSEKVLKELHAYIAKEIETYSKK